MEFISATIRGTPMRFNIDRAFAEKCVVGEIVMHRVLGPLSVEDVSVNSSGETTGVVFYGTSATRAYTR